MSWKTRRVFSKETFDEVERRVNNYEGKPVPSDLVASRGMKNIGNVGSGIGNVQCDSRSGRTLHPILDIV